MIIISIIYLTPFMTKTYADTKMSRSGGTMMGDIQMTDNRITGPSDPVNNQDAATKWYVDMNTARQRLARSSSMDTAIFKQPLLEVDVTLAKIPLIAEGTMSGGIQLIYTLRMVVFFDSRYVVIAWHHRYPFSVSAQKGSSESGRLARSTATCVSCLWLILFVGLLLVVIVIQVFHVSRIIE